MAVPGGDPGVSPGHPRLAPLQRLKVVDARGKAAHDENDCRPAFIPSTVTAGLDPANHVLIPAQVKEDVGARLKAGHDG